MRSFSFLFLFHITQVCKHKQNIRDAPYWDSGQYPICQYPTNKMADDKYQHFFHGSTYRSCVVFSHLSTKKQFNYLFLKLKKKNYWHHWHFSLQHLKFCDGLIHQLGTCDLLAQAWTLHFSKQSRGFISNISHIYVSNIPIISLEKRKPDCIMFQLRFK